MEVMDAMMDIGFPMMMAEPGRPDLRNMGKLISSAVRNVKLKDQLVAISKATADQVACEWVEHPATIALLNGIAAGAGPVDDDGNAAAYMIFAVTHRLGTGKPVGSLQAFANAMASSITESGAERSENHLCDDHSGRGRTSLDAADRTCSGQPFQCRAFPGQYCDESTPAT